MLNATPATPPAAMAALLARVEELRPRIEELTVDVQAGIRSWESSLVDRGDEAFARAQQEAGVDRLFDELIGFQRRLAAVTGSARP